MPDNREICKEDVQVGTKH